MKITEAEARCFLPYEAVPVPFAERGALSGMTLAVKDLFDVEGYPTGAGNPELAKAGGIRRKTAEAVRRLLAAGARFAGKTVTDELAFSIAGRNAHYGSPLNGAAPDRLTGGSSSGSASAVSCGLADLGLGTDTGGSVRCPASQCGLWGIRPTHGRGSLDGCRPLAPSFDTCGLLARSAADLEKGAAALYGPDEKTGPAAPRFIIAQDAWELADPETARALTGKILASGIPLEAAEIAPEGFGGHAEAFRRLQAAEAWVSCGRDIEELSLELGPGVRERFLFGKEMASADLSDSLAVKDAVASRLRRILGEDGILVFPTMPGPAPLRTAPESEIDGFRGRAFKVLSLGSLSGLPWVSVPAATAAGAPVGLSLLGPEGRDLWLLAEAAKLARSFGAA